MDVGCTLDLG